MEENIKTINLGFVNVFLVKLKDGFILIDTGISNKWTELEKRLILEGCLPNNLKLVILTHGDTDHIGNAKKLQDKYKSKVAISKADFDLIEKGIIQKRKVKRLLFKIIYSILLFLMKFHKNKENKNLFTPNLFLNDNNSLKKYGFNAKVISLPGHTVGSIAILTDKKDIFVGDTLENRKKPLSAQIIENEEDLKKSIEKIEKLDIRTVYPGHGKPFLMEDFKKDYQKNK